MGATEGLTKVVFELDEPGAMMNKTYDLIVVGAGSAGCRLPDLLPG
jgi:hypothetical protein